jgi:hypothetical protein
MAVRARVRAEARAGVRIGVRVGVRVVVRVRAQCRGGDRSHGRRCGHLRSWLHLECPSRSWVGLRFGLGLRGRGRARVSCEQMDTIGGI